MNFFSVLFNIKTIVMIGLILKHKCGADIDPPPENFD